MDNLQFQNFGPDIANPNNDPRPPGELEDQSYLFTSDVIRDRSTTAAKKNFFSFEFYQQYFDVDTDQVLSRILYRPFWISVTLIFSTAICGNLAKYIQTSGLSTSYHYGSDFRLVTGASTIIFCYVVLVPFLLYSLFWYRKSYLQYSYLDILCAYGYSLSIFIPVSILWVLQAQWFRWILILLSVALSGSVLVSSIWPAVKNDRNKAIALGTILSILLLHSLVAVGFKEYYFDVSLPSRLEIENFHLLHQQVQSIEHSHVQLKVTSMESSSIAPNEARVQQVKMKTKDDSENIGKQENNVVTKITEQVNATMVSKVAAKISKPV
ncbi:Yip1 domain protein [Onchocerca flexuosa]|uniref:Protein YIPF n=1 Tax=Onchocerca flexuosa TaxID=387005 RepID=A0A238C2Q5_9BILA|nr:Yip1 domain protein [Onchocerca flexuosa]